MAPEDKAWPITTWRRPIGEKVRRIVWHMKRKAGPLLHGGGVWVRKVRSVWHMKTKVGSLLHGGGLWVRR